MVILTAKLSKSKLIAILVVAVAVLLGVIFLANRGSGTTMETAGAKLSTPEARVEYLTKYGYQVSPEPVRTQEVQIPREFTEVYEQYNAIQKSQGFDLEKYRGKRIMQYVYRVENNAESEGEPIYATLLVYRNKLIGADLSRGGENGFLRPLLSA